MDLTEGEGNERLILNQIAEKDMKVNLDSQTVFTGKDDLMTMTVTVFTKGEPIIGVRKYIRWKQGGSGTCSPNGTQVNGRPNGLMVPKKEVNRKISAPF